MSDNKTQETRMAALEKEVVGLKEELDAAYLAVSGVVDAMEGMQIALAIMQAQNRLTGKE